jgi:hypothetical protein
MPERFEVKNAEGLLTGSLPCAPEQLGPGDTVLAVISLGTRVAIRYVFKVVPPHPLQMDGREIVHFDVCTAISDCDSSEKRQICIEAINDLRSRFEDKLGPEVLRILSLLVMYEVLDDEDLTDAQAVPDVDYRASALYPLFAMDLDDYDLVGKSAADGGKKKEKLLLQ